MTIPPHPRTEGTSHNSAILDKMAKMAIIDLVAKKYPISFRSSMKVEELPPVTASALKNSAADVLDQVAAQGAVTITRHDKPRAVLLSIEEYERLTNGEGDWLAELHQEYQGVLEQMQDPAQKAAAERAFNATPEELGAAAVRGAQRKSTYR